MNHNVFAKICFIEHKVHCWRLVKNGLAVGDELRCRKVKEGVRCVACNREKTLKHRFWDCPHACRTWKLVRGRLDYSCELLLSTCAVTLVIGLVWEFGWVGIGYEHDYNLPVVACKEWCESQLALETPKMLLEKACSWSRHGELWNLLLLLLRFLMGNDGILLMKAGIRRILTLPFLKVWLMEVGAWFYRITMVASSRERAIFTLGKWCRERVDLLACRRAVQQGWQSWYWRQWLRGGG